MQGLVQIFHLIISKLASLLDPLLQMFNPYIPLFQFLIHLLLHSFILPLLSFYDFVLFLQLPFKIFAIIPKSLNYTGISLLYVLDISCMYLGDPFFQIVNLQLVFSLYHVQLFSQHVDLILQLLPIPFVLLSLLSQSSQQFGYLIVFDSNHLSEPIQLDVEQLILILHAPLKILQLEVKDLLELVPEFI